MDPGCTAYTGRRTSVHVPVPHTPRDDGVQVSPLRSDAELLAAYVSGDDAAFEAFYRRHGRTVFRFGLRFTGDRALADDVVQDTFRAVVDQASSLASGGGGSLTGWLYVVAKRAALRTRERAERTQGDPSTTIASIDAFVALAPDDEAGDVDRMVARLPDAQREVVLLRFVDEWSLEEIASALDVPVGTVKSRLHHALKRLRAAAEGRP